MKQKFGQVYKRARYRKVDSIFVALLMKIASEERERAIYILFEMLQNLWLCKYGPQCEWIKWKMFTYMNNII